VALHCFAINAHPFAPELDRNAARTIERIVGIERINPMFERHLPCGGQYWLVVETCAAETQEFCLRAERQLAFIAFD